MLNYTCFQPENEANVAKLLDFELSDQHEIILRSKIAFIALLKWDKEAFFDQLEALSYKRPEAYACFIANPLIILSYLYQSFRGERIEQSAARELNELPHRMQSENPLVTNQLFDFLI
ncbi:hypothetical protein [Parapedobacter deserti]|uniref:hypothetical protein n=1 Tax=Parapedobacter deserti TaxID=1912957 RepID=UPI003670093E